MTCMVLVGYTDSSQGTNIISGEAVAIKLELKKEGKGQLEHEANIYDWLSGGIGIPFVRWFGTVNGSNALVIDFLGPDLEHLFKHCKRIFSVKTVLLLADQLISRIEYVHSKSVIHGDIKPQNFAIGVGMRGNQINVLDFGLAEYYRHSKSHSHRPYRENLGPRGTALYMSINSHLGVEQSRRDDMKSLGYMLLYFCRGSLPWQRVKAATMKETQDMIKTMKMTMKARKNDDDWLYTPSTLTERNRRRAVT